MNANKYNEQVRERCKHSNEWKRKNERERERDCKMERKIRVAENTPETDGMQIDRDRQRWGPKHSCILNVYVQAYTHTHTHKHT